MSFDIINIAAGSKEAKVNKKTKKMVLSELSKGLWLGAGEIFIRIGPRDELRKDLRNILFQLFAEGGIKTKFDKRIIVYKAC